MARALLVLDITFSVYRSEKYWMATCIENVLADNGTWIIPERCYLMHKEGDAKMLDPAQLRGYVRLMNVTDPENTKQMYDVRVCVAAHEERELARKAPMHTRSRSGKRARESTDLYHTLPLGWDGEH